MPGYEVTPTAISLVPWPDGAAEGEGPRVGRAARQARPRRSLKQIAPYCCDGRRSTIRIVGIALAAAALRDESWPLFSPPHLPPGVGGRSRRRAIAPGMPGLSFSY